MSAALRQHAGVEVEIVPVRTSGDEGRREVLGAFVKEIQEALLRDEIDLGLHCLKDLPTRRIDGLCFPAYLKREDPRDAVITRTAFLHQLPERAVVGTGSVRRSSQLLARRPDLQCKPLTGNVDTRLRKLSEGEYDAIILAVAGIKRLGIEGRLGADYPGLSFRALEYDEMLPAPGQAVLVLEAREEDNAHKEIAARLNDVDSHRSALAERAFLNYFGGGCSVPVAAHCACRYDLELQGLVAAPDGSKVVQGRDRGEDPVELGRRLAESLISQGAESLLQAVLR